MTGTETAPAMKADPGAMFTEGFVDAAGFHVRYLSAGDGPAVLYLPGAGGPVMTETSPVCAIGHPPKEMGDDDEVTWRTRTGRILPGVELRITDDSGAEVPWDGESLGEIEVRGPWITAEYYHVDDPAKFHDGWLRTGDVASVTPRGYVMISDRAKDVIKSGGEWVSSVDLENTLMGHDEIAEAAVIGVPDDRWDERPLACARSWKVCSPGPRTN